MKHIYRFLSLYLLLCSASALRAAAPVITSSLSSQTYWVNEDFNYTITATGSPILFYAGGYQAVGGLTFDSATGAITGAPSNAGEFEIAIAAENAALERSADAKFDVVVVPTAITSLSPANGVVGETFSYEITTNSSELVTFADDGTLPPGLTRVDNIISGTPTVSGSYTVTLSASDVNGSGVMVVTFEITGAVPVITSSLQEEILLGEDFNYTITATNSADYFNGNSSAVSGLSSVNTTTGEFSGTPAFSGNYSISLIARTPLPEGVFSLPTTLDFVVHPGLITSSNTASAVVDSPFVFEITTVNDDGLAYSNDDDLPPGLTRTDNIITGIPTLAGTYNVTISAASLNNFDDQVLTITVTDPTPEITSSLADQNILAGVPYAGYTITATYPPLTGFSEIGLSAVGGLVLDTVTGEISGTPVNSGSFPIEIRASNSTGFGDPATFNLNVSPTVITSPSSTSGVVGTPLTYEITTAGTAPLAYGVQGSLPSGLSRSGTTISGTPDQAGTYTVTLSASNLDGTGSLEVTFTITDPAPAIDSSLAAQTIIVNEPFTYSITATNNPTVFSAEGLDLIGGLVLDTGTGVISGTPANEGDWVIKIGAENGAGTSPIEDLNLEVKAAQYFLEGEVSVPFSHTLTTTLPNASIGVTGLGQIPGISRVSGTDDISGTPEKFGIYVVTVTATDEEGATDTYDLTVTINKSGGAAPIPVITSSTSILLYEGDNLDYQIQADGIPDSFEVFGLGSLGLALNSSTGEITGTPTSTGDFRLPVRVTNAAGTGSDILELTIVPEISPEVVITSPAGGNAFTAGDYIEVLINATDTDGFITAVSVSVDGVLDGFATSTGVAGQYRYILTTTAGDVGTRSLQVTATDDRDNSTDSNIQNFAVTPGAVPQVNIITPAAGFYATVGVPYEIRVSAVDPDGVIAAVGLNDILFGREPPTTSTDSDGVVTVTPGDIIEETKSFGGQQDETVLTLMQPSSTPGEYVLNVTATFTDIVDLVATAFDDAGNAVSSVPVQYSVNLGIPPDVTITSPLVGESFTLGDYVPVEVTANDADGIITQVEIFNSSISLGFADLTGLNTYRFGYLANAAGEVYLQARATDDTGNVSNSDFEIINVATGNIPTVSIDSPIAGGNSPYKLRDTVAIEISASDSDGNVTTVEVFAVDAFNGIISLGTATRAGENSFRLNYTANAVGTFNLYARAVDDRGNTSVSSIETITVVTGDLPVVAIDEPNSVSDGDSITAGDNVTILVNATDADGFITQVQIFNNSVLLGQADPTGVAGQYRYNLLTDISNVGVLSLEARATDDRGNVVSSSVVSLNVTPGSVPSVSIDSPSDGFTAQVGIPFEVRVSASDADGSIASVRLRDINFQRQEGTTDENGVFTPGAVIEETRSFNGALMQGSSVAGEYVYTATLSNPDIVDLVAVALDNAGNQVTSVPVQLTVTTGSAPTVTITSPVAGGNSPYKLGDIVVIEITADDLDGSVSGVQVYNGSAILGTATRTGNTTFSLNYIANAVGTFNLQARVTDDSGNTSVSAVETITVVTGDLPTAIITSPINGGSSPYKIGDIIPIDITASDLDGSVTAVEVFDGNTSLGTATRSGENSFRLNYKVIAVGTFDLQARVVDDRGNTSVSSIETITVVTGDLPVVAIDELNSVSDGDSITAGGTLQVLVNASDADGFITQVQIFGNEELLGQANPTGVAGQFRYNLSTDIEDVGILTLEARATDDRGNEVSSSVVNLNVTPGSVPEVSVITPIAGASLVVNQTFEIRVSATDSDGVIAGVRLSDTRFSRQPPTINGNTGIVTPGAVIESTRSFNGDLMQPSSIAGEFVYFATLTNTDIVDLEATAFDNAGNEVSAVVVQFFVTDGTPPTVSIDSPVAGSIISRGSFAPIEITASDADGTVQQIEVFNGAISLGFATPLGGLNKYRLDYQANSPGEVYLQARATDDRGNVAVSNIETFIVETGDIPVVSITSPTSGETIVAGKSTEILLEAFDLDGVITQVSVYNGDTLLGEAESTGVTVGITEQYRFLYTAYVGSGTQNLEARVVDEDGNVATSSLVQLVVLRGSSPVVEIMNPVDAEVLPVGIEIEIRVSASDVDGNITSVQLYDSNFEVYSGATIYNNAEVVEDSSITRFRSFNKDVMQLSSVPGEYVLTRILANPDVVDLVATAYDDAGNEVASLPVLFTVAAGAVPSATITTPTNGGSSPYTLGDTIAIDITAFDSDGSVNTVEVFNGAALLGTATRTSNDSFRLNYTANTVGSINLQVRVTDDSGNTAVSAIETINVVTGDLPVVAIDEPNSVSDGDSITAGDNATILVNATDADGFITQVQIFNNSVLLGQADPTGVINQYRYNLLTDISNVGVLSLEARATDDRGNVVSSSVVNLDVTPGSVPSVIIDSPSDGFTAQVGIPFEVRVSASDADGSIASVRLRDINFQREEGTTNNGVFTPGAVIEETRSFNGALMQESSVAGEYVYTATLSNPDIVDLVAVALDNAGNQVTSVPVQLTVTTGSAPTVTITNPTASVSGPYTLGDTIAIDITASDSDGSVSSVEIYNGSILLASAFQTGDSTFRYLYETVSSGLLNLQARVTDDSGNTSVSASETIIVVRGDTPNLNFTNPLSGSVVTAGDSIDIILNATDADGFINQVNIYNGSTFLGQAYQTVVAGEYRYVLQTSQSNIGTLNIWALAYDDRGNSGYSTSILTITVATGDLPTAIITSPINGVNSLYKIEDTVAIEITASDLDGSVTTVEVFDGNTSLGTATRTGDTTFRLNYTANAVGSVNLQARVTDDSGNTSVSSIETITVVTGDLPVVAIDELNSVSDGDSITAGDNVTILVNATDADGFITQVQIFNNGVLLGQAGPTGVAGQYRYNLSTDISNVGTLSLEARATDDRGNVVSSSVVSLNVTPGSVPEVSVITPIAGASLVVNQTFEIRVSATDSDGFIREVRLSDTRVKREQVNASLTSGDNSITFNPAGIEIDESTRSFNEELMQPSSVPGEFVHYATLSNADIIDLVATAFDNSGNEVSSLPIQFFVTDGIPPNVSIDSPLNGDVVDLGSFIPIEITASDADGTVQQIEVFNGATSLGFATPFGGLNKYRLDYQATSPGEVYLQARSTDDRGNVAVSNIETFAVVTGDIPVVTITSPNSGSTTVAGSYVEILINATDNDGFVTSVQVFNGTELLGIASSTDVLGSYRYNFRTSISDLGTLNLEARAIDNDGNSTSSSIVDLIVTRGSIPIVSIISPSIGETVLTNIPYEVRVSATDADGSITSVTLNYDGISTSSDVMQLSSIAGEYVFMKTFDNADVIELVAIALDDAENEVKSSPVLFTVSQGVIPTAVITSPVNGGNSPYTIGDTIAIDITAEDADGSVTIIQVYNGSALLGEATRTSNNSFRLNYTANAVGSVNLQARVTDDSGNTSVSATETITVVTGDLPVVAIDELNSVSDGDSITAGDNVTILVNATDADGFITQVQIFNNGVLLGQADPTGVAGQYRYNLSTDISNVGTLSLEARATDDRGNIVSSSAVNLDVTPGSVPSVSIDSPSDGFTAQVGVPFEVRVSASDADGSIASVRLRDINFQREEGTTDENGVFTPGAVIEETRSFNGTLMQESSTPGEYVLNATITNADIVDLVAVALDNAGNQVTSVPVQLIATSGSAPTAIITSPVNGGNSPYTRGDTIVIDIIASDLDGSLTAVEVYNGSALLGTATRTSNTTFRLNYNANVVGLFNLQARATDDSGNTSVSATETITVETGNVPNVGITSPSSEDFTLGDIIVIEITASDSDGNVTQVEVFDGIISLGLATRIGDSIFRLNYTATNVGNLDLQARATDDSGNVVFSNIKPISITVTPPVVSDFQTSLTALTTSQNVELSVRASSGNREISRVIFKANDETIGLTSQATTQIGSGTSDLYVLNWKPDTVGSFELSVEVEDEDSITTSLSGPTITVTAYDPMVNDENFVNEVYLRLFNQSPTVAQLEEGLLVLDGSIASKASYLASILASSTAKNSEIAMMVYRTMTGEWPNSQQLEVALANLLGSSTGVDALTGQLTISQPSASFPLVLRQGDTVTASVNPDPSSDNSISDPILSVRAPNGTTVAYNDDFNGFYPQVNFTADSQGTYTLVVTEFFGLTGDFLLDIQTDASGGVISPDALTSYLVPEYEKRFGALNSELGSLQQLFINKHSEVPSPLSEVRLYNSLTGVTTNLTDSEAIPGYVGNTTSFATQFAVDNEPSFFVGPNGLQLSSTHYYEMPNDPISDLKLAFAVAAFLGEDPTDQTLASYSDMPLEQALEDILAEAYISVPSALADATSLGSDWYDSSWFGMFAYPANSSNWIYSWRLGWVYVAPSGSSSGAWLYSSKLGAWLWSNSEMNGFYFQAGRNTWLYMLPVGADSHGAWLNYMDTNQWQFVSP